MSSVENITTGNTVFATSVTRVPKLLYLRNTLQDADSNDRSVVVLCRQWNKKRKDGRKEYAQTKRLLGAIAAADPPAN